MRRKTKIVLAITFMIAVLVSGFSYLYISQILRQRINSAGETASLLAAQLAYAAKKEVPDLGDTRVDTNNPAAVRDAIAEYFQEDQNLNDMVESVIGNWPIVYDVAIVDVNGRAILDSNPDLNNKIVPRHPDFQVLRNARFREQLRLIYSPASVYDVNMPLQLDGTPFGSIRIGISTVFLKNELTPRLQHAVLFSTAAILLSLFLSAAISNLALGPLKEISRNLDSVSAGGTEVLATGERRGDEYGLVTLKIAHIGQQIRDTNQIFSALKDNVEQVMATLQDGLIFFTQELRVVLVSASAERFLGRPRRDILGHSASEIFSDGSALSLLLLNAFQRRRPLNQREVESDRGKRIQVSLDFIQEQGSNIGALLTMRDAESVRRIEDEIEMSRRLSASGRLTRGVAHEVKNPINAIVLHLQLLQNKLQQVDPDTRRHVDIIGNEIRRLDRVVQILVDFTRPRDLRLEEVDMRKILEGVLALAAPEAARQGVRIVQQLPNPDEALMVRVDSDLMKQAILNLVLNGVQAMTEGGTLTLLAKRDDEMVLAEVLDQGSGIPPEAREKIFELYFTTKGEQGGSGIGLAQTYQIMQWHYGSVEFDSIVGAGTTFRLRLPAAAAKADRREEMTA